MFFVNPANHIRVFTVIIESDNDPGYIPVGEIPTKGFPVCVLNNLRKSLD